MTLESTKTKILTTIPQIEDLANKNGFSLRITKNSLSLSGNNFSATGEVSTERIADIKKVRIKIVTSPNKFHDIKREEFMYGFIRKLGYPCPTVILSGGDFDSEYMFLIREDMSGSQLRGASSEVIKSSLPKLTSFFVDLHSHSLDDFGLIEKIDGKWKGDSTTWIDSLEKRARESIFRIQKMGIQIDHNLFDNLKSILNKNFDLLNINRGSMLHGDAGLTNFLGDESDLTAIIDPEFAVIGDPAYEFCARVGDEEEYSTEFIKNYFSRMKKNNIDVRQESFFKRGTLYSPFIVTNIIYCLGDADNTKGVEYFLKVLPNELEKALRI